MGSRHCGSPGSPSGGRRSEHHVADRSLRSTARAIRPILTELAERVAGWARPGEEVEVYVARGDETEVRAYDGEVESLSSASSSGLGIRVVTEHRQGFAWAGSLDEEVLGPTLAEARDNADVRHPRRARRPCGPRRGGPGRGRPVGRRGSPRSRRRPRSRWRSPSSAGPRCRPTDPPGRRSPTTGTPRSRCAPWPPTGISTTSAKTSGYVSVGVIAGDGDDSQTG